MSAPEPPADLGARSPKVLSVPRGSLLHRFYNSSHEPIHFDSTPSGRFNAPDGSYGTLYAARDRAGAFAETFLRTPGRTQIDFDLLARKAYVQMQNVRALTLISLTGPGLAVLGATAEVTHGGLPYDIPQKWSKALAEHSLAADGIVYTARHDDEQLCYAIHERAAAALFEVDRTDDLDRDWFWELANRYGVGLAPS
ncbi:RES family NAD+ phosphorylase [Aurantimonas sp. HBX-1]|uniref:RES family NAD+ phosphorylase n=1 Tax=Aurantimonas sp. HBX-1 TaxID=2906072 RepID=UPI001F3D3B5F|nr:RES family NAD+ phosphorylase [Aurantimonas sp. HBX-1]UIJ73047.1 RES family NAD+ phosphorylase [Aurantimonas sp. HBX-1]